MEDKGLYISGEIVEEMTAHGKIKRTLFVGKRCLWTEMFDEFDEFYFETLCKHVIDHKDDKYCPFCGLLIVVDEFEECEQNDTDN